MDKGKMHMMNGKMMKDSDMPKGMKGKKAKTMKVKPLGKPTKKGK